MVRTSTRCCTAFSSSKATNSSSDRVEWPIVHTTASCLVIVLVHKQVAKKTGRVTPPCVTHSVIANQPASEGPPTFRQFLPQPWLMMVAAEMYAATKPENNSR